MMFSMSKSPQKLGKTINVEVSNISKSEECRLLIENSIKFILSSRKIIPYPYCHLYSVVNQSTSDKKLSAREVNFEKIHMKKASAIIAKVDAILKGFQMEFSSPSQTQIREVALLIGPTIQCPKEVYLFKLPGTFPDPEYVKPGKSDHMRHVVLNPDLTTFISKSIQLTNMYVLVKKPEGDKATWICPIPNYEIPKRAPVAVINMCTCPKLEETQIRNHTDDISSLNNLGSPTNIVNEECKNRKRTWQKMECGECIHVQENPGTSDHVTENNRHSFCGYSSNDNQDEELSRVLNVESVQNKSLSQTVGGDARTPIIINPHAVVSEKETKEFKMENIKVHISNKDKHETQIKNKIIWYIASEYLQGFKQPVLKKLNK